MIAESLLIDKVRTLLNEVRSEGGLTLITDDTLLLDRYITELLPEAVLFVQMNRKRGVVNGKNFAECSVSTTDDGKGTIALPEDYVRLVSLKLNVWKKPCFVAAETDSPTDTAQHNKYMQAGKYSPVCIEIPTAEGTQLNVYPVAAESTPEVEYLIYEARYDSNKGLATKNDFLFQAVAYQCAALVCNVFEKYDAANSFLGLATALCNNK